MFEYHDWVVLPPSAAAVDGPPPLTEARTDSLGAWWLDVFNADEHDVRVRDGLAAMRQIEEEHGVVTAAECAWGAARLAEADALTRENKRGL